jgi:hypothetical protein
MASLGSVKRREGSTRGRFSAHYPAEEPFDGDMHRSRPTDRQSRFRAKSLHTLVLANFPPRSRRSVESDRSPPPPTESQSGPDARRRKVHRIAAPTTSSRPSASAQRLEVTVPRQQRNSPIQYSSGRSVRPRGAPHAASPALAPARLLPAPIAKLTSINRTCQSVSAGSEGSFGPLINSLSTSGAITTCRSLSARSSSWASSPSSPASTRSKRSYRPATIHLLSVLPAYARIELSPVAYEAGRRPEMP